MTNGSEPGDTLRVALYIRVSTDEQVERFGIPLQKEALLALIKSRGKLGNGKDVLTLANREAGEACIYLDEGISGTTPLDERPAFAKLKEDIVLAPEGSKPFDVVAVYKIDRFARKLKILLEVIDFFEEHGIKFISVNESIDTSTPFGKAILGIIGVIAELEIETIKLRTQAGREQSIKAGNVMGRSAHYGYIKDENGRHKIFEKEAEVIRSIFRMLVNEKKTVYQISRYLIEHNYPSPESSAAINRKRAGEAVKKQPINFWRQERIRAILQDERYIGHYYYNRSKGRKKLPKSEWKLSPFRIPPIMDVFTFEQAQILLGQLKHQRVEVKDNHIYLLSGLLRCDGCYDPARDKGGRVHWYGERKELGRGSGNFTHFYKCGRKVNGKSAIACDTLPLPASQIEDYIVEQAKRLLKNPVAAYNHQLKLKSTKAEIKTLQKKQNDLINLINSLPGRRKRLQEQHELGFKDISQLKEDIRNLDTTEKQYQKELREIEYQISQNTLSQGYETSLNLFSEKYARMLDDLSSDRKTLYDMLHELIEEIIVYSRPVREGDVVAGKKKSQQKIPYRINIKLKLPQEILRQMAESLGGSSGQKVLTGAEGGS